MQGAEAAPPLTAQALLLLLLLLLAKWGLLRLRQRRERVGTLLRRKGDLTTAFAPSHRATALRGRLYHRNHQLHLRCRHKRLLQLGFRGFRRHKLATLQRSPRRCRHRRCRCVRRRLLLLRRLGAPAPAEGGGHRAVPPPALRPRPRPGCCRSAAGFASVVAAAAQRVIVTAVVFAGFTLRFGRFASRRPRRLHRRCRWSSPPRPTAGSYPPGRRGGPPLIGLRMRWMRSRSRRALSHYSQR